MNCSRTILLKPGQLIDMALSVEKVEEPQAPSKGVSAVLVMVKLRLPVFAVLPWQEVALHVPESVSESTGLPPLVATVPVILPERSMLPWKVSLLKPQMAAGSARAFSLKALLKT